MVVQAPFVILHLMCEWKHISVPDGCPNLILFFSLAAHFPRVGDPLFSPTFHRGVSRSWVFFAEDTATGGLSPTVTLFPHGGSTFCPSPPIVPGSCNEESHVLHGQFHFFCPPNVSSRFK